MYTYNVNSEIITSDSKTSCFLSWSQSTPELQGKNWRLAWPKALKMVSQSEMIRCLVTATWHHLIYICLGPLKSHVGPWFCTTTKTTSKLTTKASEYLFKTKRKSYKHIHDNLGRRKTCKITFCSKDAFMNRFVYG